MVTPEQLLEERWPHHFTWKGKIETIVGEQATTDEYMLKAIIRVCEDELIEEEECKIKSLSPNKK